MKKFLSIILALVTMFCIGTTAFAYENVDNTFDNFTPGSGLAAPDNWYDPFCYDADGTIRMDCFAAENCTYYCKEARKIYTNFLRPTADSSSSYFPYTLADSSSEYGVSEYCPYCGQTSNLSMGLPNNNGQPDYTKTHTAINEVYFGTTCESCGLFPVDRFNPNTGFLGCTNCYHGNYSDKYYRFIPKAYETAEFYHIFSESEYKFGDGQDGYIEDVGVNNIGLYLGWNPGSSEEPAELTFWEKIVQFFVSIGDFFVKLFTWSW